MKKFTLFLKALTLPAIACIAIVACQKEQNSVSQETNATNDNEKVVGVAGGGKYSGSITGSYASALAANYLKVYGDDRNHTNYVAFSAKDLKQFITDLQTKYKSDTIYVNFGVYGKSAAPVNSRDYGRLTVFFTGNNISFGTTGGRRNDGFTASDPSQDEFLNHGDLTP